MSESKPKAILEAWEWKRQLVDARLFDAPFTNFGVNAPMPMFTENELNDFINICGVLEREIYAEA